MKRFAALALFAAMATPAGAAPKWVTAVPRAVGRTYGNMFTFRHPVLALEQWASVAALTFDEKTTMDDFARCAGCRESMLLDRGHRYGVGTAALQVAIGGTAYATFEQYGDELLRHDTDRFWRNINNSLVAVPLVVHLSSGIHNMRVPADSPRVLCLDRDRDCERGRDRE